VSRIYSKLRTGASNGNAHDLGVLKDLGPYEHLLDIRTTPVILEFLPERHAMTAILIDQNNKEEAQRFWKGLLSLKHVSVNDMYNDLQFYNDLPFHIQAHTVEYAVHANRKKLDGPFIIAKQSRLDIM
jgi:hypothetical protein